MSQDLNKIEKTYDAVADKYAAAFTCEHDKKPKDREMLCRFITAIDGRGPVWDLGCGPGQTSRFLNDRGLAVSGMDLSAAMVEQAKLCNPGIHFRKGDMLHLDFGDDSIAGAVAFYSIVHFSDEQVRTAFREIFRVLQPGGILLLAFHEGESTIHVDSFLETEVDVDFMFFTPGFILDSLETGGFVNIIIEEREPYPDIEYQSRRAYIFAEKP